MGKVAIMSRSAFLEFTPDVEKENIVAIRIGDNAPKRDSASKRYADTLALDFFDNETYIEKLDRNAGPGTNAVSEQDKREIDEFVTKYADKYFVIHCDAGRSRSAAVGFYILKKLGCTAELNEKKLSYRYSPNLEVYGMLIGKLYGKYTASELRKEIDGLENEK